MSGQKTMLVANQATLGSKVGLHVYNCTTATNIFTGLFLSYTCFIFNRDH